METIDKILSLNVIITGRKDHLQSGRHLYLLTILRQHNQRKLRSNTISLFLSLRLQLRQQSTTMINERLKDLVNDGYVIKSGTSWKITQSGLQTLSEIERQLNECSFKLRKSDTLKISVKRPKTL